jgi:hypothetical protein
LKDTLFYKEFFARDTLLWEDSLLFRDRRQEVATRTEETGKLLPETLQRNDAANALLLGTLLFLLVILHFSSKSLRTRFSKLFLSSNLNAESTEAETSEALRVHICFTFQTALLLALLFCFYAQNRGHLELMTLSTLHLLGIYTVLLLAFIVTKQYLTHIVNSIFFTRQQCRRWTENFMTIFAIQSLALFPITLVAIYFDLPVKIVFQALLIVLLFVKSLTLIKSFTIFFRHLHGVLHLFVYFCALEALPIAVGWATLVAVTQKLTTYF